MFWSWKKLLKNTCDLSLKFGAEGTSNFSSSFEVSWSFTPGNQPMSSNKTWNWNKDKIIKEKTKKGKETEIKSLIYPGTNHRQATGLL